jgi:hypothetical protein
MFSAEPDEFVVHQAVRAIGQLCALGVFRTHVLFSIAKKLSPLLCHPNIWIRHGTHPSSVALSPAQYLLPAMRALSSLRLLCAGVIVHTELLHHPPLEW